MPPLDPAAAPERVADGCIRIPLPDPFVPGVTAAFLVGGDEAPVLVDAGADTVESAAALASKLRGLGYSVGDLPMLLSHTHLDHAGGLLRARPRSLAAHANAAAEMRRVDPVSSRGPEALRRMGVDDETIAAYAPGGEPVAGTPLADIPVDHELEGESGGVAGAAGWRWLLAEGHAPGHLALFDDASRTLLGADQFLQKWKTPLIVSDPDFDSFGAYLASIDTVLALRPERICSSHTETIEDAVGWLTDTRAALTRRLERVASSVTDSGQDTVAVSAEDVLARLYPTARRGPVRIVFLREILAMLRHLAFAGEIERRVEGGVERFG